MRGTASMAPPWILVQRAFLLPTSMSTKFSLKHEDLVVNVNLSNVGLFWGQFKVSQPVCYLNVMIKNKLAS